MTFRGTRSRCYRETDFRVVSIRRQLRKTNTSLYQHHYTRAPLTGSPNMSHWPRYNLREASLAPQWCKKGRREICTRIIAQWSRGTIQRRKLSQHLLEGCKVAIIRSWIRSKGKQVWQKTTSRAKSLAIQTANVSPNLRLSKLLQSINSKRSSSKAKQTSEVRARAKFNFPISALKTNRMSQHHKTTVWTSQLAKKFGRKFHRRSRSSHTKSLCNRATVWLPTVKLFSSSSSCSINSSSKSRWIEIGAVCTSTSRRATFYQKSLPQCRGKVPSSQQTPT